MRRRALLAPLALLLVSLASPDARAQQGPPSLDLRGTRASLDPAAGLYQEPADSPGSGEWSVGLWTSYAYRPITLRDARTDAVVFDVIKHQVTSDLTAGVGISHRFHLGLDLPVLLYQTGDRQTASSIRVLGDSPLPSQAIGDLGLVGKVTLIRPTGGDLGGFALAFHERFTVPTGDPASYLGEGAVSSESRLLADYRWRWLGVHAAAGVKLRGENESFACGAFANLDDCKTRFGHELPFGVGADVKPRLLGFDDKDRWSLYLDTHGRLPISPVAPGQSTGASSLRIGVGARYVLVRDLSMLAGFETALIAGVGDAPARAVLSLAWAPREHDLDHDRIDDDLDQCRELAEDKDGFEDEDGCPELDNDGDGIPDTADQCPNVAEDKDGWADTDGCPEPDNDGDKILDADDTCPNEAGPPSADVKRNGCALHDRDGDGLDDRIDHCPDQAEDTDSFEDDDGCPELDNDGDGIPDAQDACPNVKGIDAADPKLRGCPDPDPDKDTFLGQDDRCPDQAETWNNVDDADGCPDEAPKGKPGKAGKPPIAVTESKTKGTEIALDPSLKVTATGEIDPASTLTLRALGSELLAHPAWSVKVGVRVAKKESEDEAQARASAIVTSLRRFTRRETSAAVAGWDTVKGAPRAGELGIGILLDTGGDKPVEKPVTAPTKSLPVTPKTAPPKPPSPPAPPPVKAPSPKAPLKAPLTPKKP